MDFHKLNDCTRKDASHYTKLMSLNALGGACFFLNSRFGQRVLASGQK